MIKRATLIILDSLGIGELPDAALYNDAGADTLGHIFSHRGLAVPNLCRLGVGKLSKAGCPDIPAAGCYGRLHEISPGKDTTTGHWEMTGVALDFSFPVFPEGFPGDIINEFEERIGRKTIGNFPCSGTEILRNLGSEHCRTGFPIVYTSADSVFQVAAHRDIVPLEKLYEYCRIAREILGGSNPVARVIARPFKGDEALYVSDNASRKDYSIEPPSDTLLDNLKNEGKFVCGVGKIGDIFAHRGLTEEIKTTDNTDTALKTAEAVRKYRGRSGLIMSNLVEFDSVYGHRRDVEGYGKALELFDSQLPQILDAMSDEDILMISADHGCDPAHDLHPDHTREYVPLLVCGNSVNENVNLGLDLEFSDVGQTISDILGSRRLPYGKSFREALLKKGG